MEIENLVVEREPGCGYALIKSWEQLKKTNVAQKSHKLQQERTATILDSVADGVFTVD